MLRRSRNVSNQIPSAAAKCQMFAPRAVRALPVGSTLNGMAMTVQQRVAIEACLGIVSPD